MIAAALTAQAMSCLFVRFSPEIPYDNEWQHVCIVVVDGRPRLIDAPFYEIPVLQ